MSYIETLTLVGLLGAAAFSAPVLAQGPSPATAAAPSAPAANDAPMPTATQNAGLCGITAADVDSIVEHYNLDPDMNAVSQALSKPLNCGAYGELCSALAPAAAHAYVCNVWNNLADHKPVAFAINEANNLLDQGLTSCTADVETCQEICDARGTGEVLSCEGYYWQGTCHSIPLCQLFDLRDIVYFDESLVGPFPI